MMRRIRMLAMMVAVLAGLGPARAQEGPQIAALSGIPGHPDEDAVDMRVKVIGGYVAVERTRKKGDWTFNGELADLKLSGNCASGAPPSDCRVARGKNVYTHVTGSSPVRYARGFRSIVRQGSGWRWADEDALWIEYGASGKALAYGDRRGTLATVLRDAAGRIAGFADRLGRQVIFYDRDDEGRVIEARDDRGRSVGYTYEGSHLVEVRDVLGHIWKDTYSGDQLATRKDPEERVTSYAYDGNGALVRIQGPAGYEVQYRFDYEASDRLHYVRQQVTGGRTVESWLHPDHGLVRQLLNGRQILSMRRDGNARLFTDESGNTTRLERDSAGRVTGVTYPDGATVRRQMAPGYNLPRSITNENGVTSTFEYDAHGNLLRMTEAVGTPQQRVTERGYDAFGQMTSERQIVDGGSADRIAILTYDVYGNVATLTDPEGNLYRFDEHDALGNLTRFVDPRGKPWRFFYDAAGRRRRTLGPMGEETFSDYDKVGNLIYSKDEQGAETRRDYNGLNLLTKETDALGNETRFDHSPQGFLRSQTDPDGNMLRYAYDADGRRVSITDATGNVVQLEYLAGRTTANPAAGRLERIRFPSFVRERQFDTRGRVSSERDLPVTGTATTSSYAYDGLGNLVGMTDRAGRVARLVYDALSRSTRIDWADGRVVLFQRDLWGQALRVVGPRQNAVEYAYDKIGRTTLERLAEGGTTRFEYDGVSNLTRVVDPRTAALDYEYNDSGHLVVERSFAPGATIPTATVSYARNRRGDLVGYDDGTVVATYDVDALRRVHGETIDFGVFTRGAQYDYHRNGLLAAETGPDGTTYAFGYDGDGKLRTVDIPGTGAITFNTYEWMAPTKITLPGGGTQEFGYDALLRPTRSAATDPAARSISDRRYVWDAMDMLTEQIGDEGSVRYGYDPAYRLTSVEDDDGVRESFAYDESGNRLPANAALRAQWSYGPNDQILATDGATYAYDAAGNRTRRTTTSGTETLYFYDEQSRLVRVEEGGSVIARYGYDPFGRRQWKETGGARRYFYYSRDGLVAELDATGTVTRSFGYAPGSADWTTAPLFVRDASGYAYVHTDPLGRPDVLTTGDGTVVWSGRHSAYGITNVEIESRGYPLRLAGQYHDGETGLHQNFFRDYDPEVGSYIESDPLGLGGGLNRYAYTEGNPIIQSDALGLSSGCSVQNAQAAADKAFDPVGTVKNEVKSQVGGAVNSAKKCGTDAGKWAGGDTCAAASAVWNCAKTAANVLPVARGVTGTAKGVAAGARVVSTGVRAAKTNGVKTYVQVMNRAGKRWVREESAGYASDCAFNTARDLVAGEVVPICQNQLDRVGDALENLAVEGASPAHAAPMQGPSMGAQ